jgi:hypothetical protein
MSFLPTFSNQFINLDDPQNLLANPYYRGFGIENLRWMFSHFHLGVYVPVTWVTFAADYLLWGMNPAGYHFQSLLWHVGNALLVYLIARKLYTGSPAAADGIAAAAAALVFAMHPLRVESVAWATERRDVVSGFFLLLSFYLYVSGNDGKDHHFSRWGAAIAFLIALLAKPTPMLFPVFLVLWESTRRPAGRSLPLTKMLIKFGPFFLASGVLGGIALCGQSSDQALAPLTALGWPGRIALSLSAMSFYLKKLVWPFGLSTYYDLPDFHFFPVVPLLLAGIPFLILSVLVVRYRKRNPELFLAYAWYVLMALPVAGLFTVGAQRAADRYSYLPVIGLSIWIAAALQRPGRRKAASIAAPILLLLGIGTYRQTAIWHDSLTLWRHALKVDPLSPMANLQYGTALADERRPAEAIPHFRIATQSPYTMIAAHNNLGAALASQGRVREALPHFRLVAERDPANQSAQRNLARALQLLKRVGPGGAHPL